MARGNTGPRTYGYGDEPQMGHQSAHKMIRICNSYPFVGSTSIPFWGSIDEQMRKHGASDLRRLKSQTPLKGNGIPK